MQTCKTCFAAVDVEFLPVIGRTVPPRGGLPEFLQEDRNCPRCGSLVLRTIDGMPVGSGFIDERPAKAAASEAKAAAEAKAKAAAEAKAKSAAEAKAAAKVKPSK